MHSNWLVNYRGGFIRRGLGGEIIFWLSSLFKISPITTMTVISVALWLTLIIWFVIKFYQRNYPFFILSLPFFLGETILLDPSLFLRQDSLILLLFISMLTILFQTRTLREPVLFFFLNSLFILAILIHEAIFFFSFPLLFITYYRKYTTQAVKTFLFFLPSITVFILCFILPERSSVEKMLQLTPEIERNDVWFMTITTKQNFIAIWENFNKPNAFFTLLYLMALSAIIFFVCINFEKLKVDTSKEIQINKTYLSQILLLQFASIFPLFTCGWDYGRWFFLWITSSFIYFIIAYDYPFDLKFDILKKLPKYINNPRPLVVFCTAIIINCQFCLPFDVNFYSRTPMYLVARTIVKTVFYAVTFLS
ncbi:hypothetical protein J6Y50_05930 [bacterium]|nr:hypothetical protein [bacterium]